MLPLWLGRRFYFVLANPERAVTTVVGSVELTGSGTKETGSTLSHRFEIGPGQHVAVAIDP